ncbi:MAG: hypothetical protein SWY16_19550 [Cyanobacteriota bacterium]|nr:hypothetical protein [Cyanobacteriota bacterium]
MTNWKSSKSQKRNCRISVNLTETEKAIVQNRAEQFGLSDSEYIRRQALRQPISWQELCVTYTKLGEIGSHLIQIRSYLSRTATPDRSELAQLSALLHQLPPTLIELRHQIAKIPRS